jgi:replication factor A1
MANLTRGSILRSYKSEVVENAVVQIIDIKKIGASSAGAADRYRLVISDSQHYQQAMLTTQLNPLVESKQLQQWSIVRLKEYLCNLVANRRIIIVLQLDVLGPHPEMIGKPINVDQAANTPVSAPTPAPVQQAAPQQQRYQPPVQQGYQARPQQQQSFKTQSPFGQDAFSPINSLNPYRNRWTIKARVTAKSDMKTWTNQKGDGKLFSVDLLDQEGGQIRATMFNDAADRLYPIFQQDKVYTISKGQLKLANKKFSRLPNEYEITLNNDAEVAFFGEDTSIQQQVFDFSTIERIQTREPDDFVDIIGIVQSVGPLGTILTKKQQEMKKRQITLTDQSLLSVDLTLWQDQAEKFSEIDLANSPVFAAKSCKVSDFGGKSLNASFGSHFFVNPDIKEAHELRAWFDSKGKDAHIKSISDQRSGGGGGNDVRKQFADIKDENLGFKEKPDYLSVRGTITFFQHDPDKPPWYNACPTPKCNKKVMLDEANNLWQCEKCNQSFPKCDPRYILRLMACDGSGSEWLTAFNEAAEVLVGHKASDVNDLKDEDRPQYESIFTNANFRQYIFKIRTKAEQVQDQMQVKCSIQSVTPVNFKTEGRFLLDQINAYG